MCLYAAFFLYIYVRPSSASCISDTIQEAALLLYKVESASKSAGLFLNPSNTKYIHINPSANDSVHSSDGSQIEKVEDFKYLGSYTNSQHDIQCRKAQA